MKDIHEATRRAREVFGSAVQRVTQYTEPNWRDRGWRGWRVTMVGEIIHWMTQKGVHQKWVCCRPSSKQEQMKVEVVRR